MNYTTLSGETLKPLETLKLCTKQNLVTFGLDLEQLLQITEHPLATFAVPEAVKQATKARFAVGEQVALIPTSIKGAEHHSWCQSLSTATDIVQPENVILGIVRVWLIV